MAASALLCKIAFIIYSRRGQAGRAPCERLGVGAQVEGVEAEVGRQAVAEQWQKLNSVTLGSATCHGNPFMPLDHGRCCNAERQGQAERRWHSLGLLQVRRRLRAGQPAACCRARHGADLQIKCTGLSTAVFALIQGS